MRPGFYSASTNTVGFFPLSFNSYSPPLHFLYSRCSGGSSSFPWQQLPGTSRAFNSLNSDSSGLRVPFLPGADVARQTEMKSPRLSFSQRTSCQPKASGVLGRALPCAGHRGDFTPHCHFSLFPVWAPQGLCEVLVGSENGFHAARGHLAVMKRLLQGRSDPAFPKPDNSLHPDLSAPWFSG